MLYPTLNANYRAKDGHMFQLSFSSNRSYPDYWSTQPTVQYVDSYTEVHGNPVLKPSSDYLAVLAYILKSKYVLLFSMKRNLTILPSYLINCPTVWPR